MHEKATTLYQKLQLPLTFLMDGSECHAASRIGKELDWNMPGVEMDFNLFNGSLRQTVHDKDSNGWSDPGGKGFMVRSRTYDQDSLKVCAFATSNPYPLLPNHRSDIDRI